ncbi:SIK1-like protein [Fusarium denticulatum]|nr:SIK1-like protein [Fusarium denticulatum]
MGGGPEGFRTVAYFVNWAIYARKHRPQDLPVENLTHVLYSFANVRSDSGEVHLTDSWADTDIHWDGDSWNDQGTNLYGCMKQLNLLKRRNRNLKVLLSVGGWTYSSNFKAPASTPRGRDTFAKSCVDLLKNLGFDGIDIDWEYPQNADEARDYVELLAAVRREMDAYAQTLSQPYHFELTVACPAGATNFQKLDIRGMDRYLDFWNLMAYDYAGSWDSVAGHQANLYPSPDNPQSTPFSTSAAVDFYVRSGVSPGKIVLGMPLYGRAFQNTDGPGRPYQGTGEGTWEAGVHDYKKLPLEGATEYGDRGCCASYCYNPQTRTMVTYDTPRVAWDKAEYVKKWKLGGAMWWESSADKTGDQSLITTVVNGFGGQGALMRQDNCMEYPATNLEPSPNPFDAESFPIAAPAGNDKMSHIDYALYESPVGYALFKVVHQQDAVGLKLKETQAAVNDLAKFGKMVKLANFSPFRGHVEALENINLVTEGIVSDYLKSVLELNLPQTSGKKTKVVLGVSEKNLAGAIKGLFPGLECETADTSDIVGDVIRGIRLHADKLLGGLKYGDVEKAGLGMGHAYSRAKVKFSVTRNDNHIIQASATIDFQDKGVNQFFMRVREWYGWHFPELIKIVSDNYTYCKLVLAIGDKKSLNDDKLHDIAALVGEDGEKAQAIIDAAKVSMGLDISAADLEIVHGFAEAVVKQADNRKSTSAYLEKKMSDIAPNLQTLIGTPVAARLISHAGSLTNLSKYPASTLQILGAEKALFRALKTKSNTPKYGLIYHSSFIGKAGPKNKGRISRYLANKCSMASRIDNFSEEPSTRFGEALKQQVEDRLEFYATGKKPAKNTDVMKGVMDLLDDGDNAGSDEEMADAPEPETKKSKKDKKEKKEKKEKKDKKEKRKRDEEDAEPVKEDGEKKKKKKRKSKAADDE